MSCRCFCVEYDLQFLQPSKIADIERWRICNEFCINFEETTPKNNEMLSKVFRSEAMRIKQMFERPKFDWDFKMLLFIPCIEYWVGGFESSGGKHVSVCTRTDGIRLIMFAHTVPITSYISTQFNRRMMYDAHCCRMCTATGKWRPVGKQDLRVQRPSI
jgi:hypothetical protein